MNIISPLISSLISLLLIYRQLKWISNIMKYNTFSIDNEKNDNEIKNGMNIDDSNELLKVIY